MVSFLPQDKYNYDKSSLTQLKFKNMPYLVHFSSVLESHRIKWPTRFLFLYFCFVLSVLQYLTCTIHRTKNHWVSVHGSTLFEPYIQKWFYAYLKVTKNIYQQFRGSHFGSWTKVWVDKSSRKAKNNLSKTVNGFTVCPSSFII